MEEVKESKEQFLYQYIFRMISARRLVQYKDDVGKVPTKDIVSGFIHINNVFAKDYYELMSVNNIYRIVENFKAHGRERICFKVRKVHLPQQINTAVKLSPANQYDLYFFKVDKLLKLVEGI